MTAFLWITLVAYALTLGIDLIYLAQNNYPRVSTTRAHSDVIGVIIAAGMTVWTCFLLFGG